jgi:hypothetical protein
MSVQGPEVSFPSVNKCPFRDSFISTTDPLILLRHCESLLYTAQYHRYTFYGIFSMNDAVQMHRSRIISGHNCISFLNIIPHNTAKCTCKYLKDNTSIKTYCYRDKLVSAE